MADQLATPHHKTITGGAIMTESRSDPAASEPEFDKISFRNALGQFATGVTIITAIGKDGTPVGVTANSFNSASLDPPLVLWSLSKNSGTLAAFRESKYFAVHILSATQIELSNRFAAPRDDKFDGIAIEQGLGQIPLLDGCAARFECKTSYQYEGGDHIIFVGEVQRFVEADRQTLLYHKGKYALARHPDATPGDDASDPPGGFVDDYLAYLLIDASRSFLSRFKECIHASGLDLPGWRTLAQLTDQDGRTAQAMLKKGAAEDADSLLSAHERLEAAGMIMRDPEPAEELLRPVHLTEQGEQTVIPILAAAKSLEADALSDLESDEEVRILKNALRKVAMRMGEPG
jgi:3-hydroxy-9,10-secoandrosta-1,3,5(10)-triene-9,17-dione monooxygenase reductase component